MSLSLSYDQALAALTEVATENPDREIADVGGLCTYFFTDQLADDANRTITQRNVERAGDGLPLLSPVEPGQPNCIVGQVMAKRGVTLDDVGHVPSNAYGQSVNAGFNVDELVSVGWLDIDTRTHVLLQTAQIKQDGGKPWSEAVAGAVEVVDQGEEHDTYSGIVRFRETLRSNGKAIEV